MTNFIQEKEKPKLCKELWVSLHNMMINIVSLLQFNLVFDKSLPYGFGSSDANDHTFLYECLKYNKIEVEAKSDIDFTE